MSDLAIQKSGGIQIHTLADLRKFADLVAEAQVWMPKGMTIPQAMLAMQMGMEIGLTPLQSIQNIAVINNRPAIYGDAMPALIAASNLMEAYTDKMVRNAEEGLMAVVIVKRRGRQPIQRTFSERRAKVARLWNKPGPWTDYPERMLLMRARTFAFRDEFADVLKGLTSIEEARDIPTDEPTTIRAEIPQLKGLPGLDEVFAKGKKEFTQSRKEAVTDIEPEPQEDDLQQAFAEKIRPESTSQIEPESEFEAAPMESMEEADTDTDQIPLDTPTPKRGPGRPKGCKTKPPPPPPPPRSIDEELRHEIRDLVIAIREEKRVPAKEPPDLDTMSIDDLRRVKAKLSQTYQEIGRK